MGALTAPEVKQAENKGLSVLLGNELGDKSLLDCAT
jgi:hypothetical protein